MPQGLPNPGNVPPGINNHDKVIVMDVLNRIKLKPRVEGVSKSENLGTENQAETSTTFVFSLCY